jgi:hypothetical protein
MRNVAVAAVIATLLFPLAASADEQLVPLVANGDWGAFSHSESMSTAPDFCVAMNVVNKFILRADEDGIEVRYVDDSWSLPASVSGNLVLKVNGDTYTLPITDNTNDMVMATISQDDLEKIVADMNKAGSMSLIPGTGAPVPISLNGSNQAVTAFLTCANIDQPGSTGGSNPFQAPASGAGTQSQ